MCRPALCRGLTPVVCVMALFCLVGCRQEPPGPQSGPSSAALPNATPAPPSVSVTHAKNFTVETRDGVRVVKVLEPWRAADTGFEYALVKKGDRAPAGFKPEQVLEVPAQRVVAMSTTQLPILKALGCLDRLMAVADGKTPCTEEVVARIKSGDAVAVGEGQTVNLEKLVALDPDVILDSALGDPQYYTYPKLLEAGLHVAIDGSYMESTPLGRAEWVKFFGLLLGKEAEAEAAFAAIETEYNGLVAKVKAASKRPTVFAGMDFRGTWYVPGGKSYVSKWFEDAGAAYVWADDATTASIPMDFEAVLAKAQNADFWLNPETCTSLSQLAAADERHKLFKAYEAGNVYNHSKRMNAAGGDDYWENGIANPHKVLADLVSIFHPEILPEHETVWYEKLK